ncbi:hypothetical protein [Billgrantia ethanolica]|uniref:Uncharacterized protein n=1 Tax=Billgrantia ethanolica TaxID=2733486 RepID=A0ABS9A014_9GAMM|nr:hypothetical protein [Halomonas ethanolica]MCE8002161.1 hypothetical protein [Halomonas ethanolica]
MTEKQLGPLTIKKLIHHGQLYGVNSLVHRFCDAVNDGEVPDMEDLKAVAYALELLRDGNASDQKLRDFAGRLGIKKKQGKGESSKQDHFKQAISVARYFVKRAEYIAAGESEKVAEAYARALVASELGIKDRAMRNRIEKHGEFAEQICRYGLPDELRDPSE